MIRKILTIILFLITVSPVMHAQEKTVFGEAFMDKLFIKFKQIQKARDMEKQQEVKDFEAALDKALAARFALIQQMQKEEAQMKRDYKPGYQHKPGEMNLFPVFEDIPPPYHHCPKQKLPISNRNTRDISTGWK